ncbi:MAG: hypothetical protein D6677_12380 [Calditrichaeota bacterium]|nr:MAG: hypothetical protein D6677_12380 [Calditrichota bacterium]
MNTINKWIFIGIFIAAGHITGQANGPAHTTMVRWQKQMLAIRLTAETMKRWETQNTTLNGFTGNPEFDALAASINVSAIELYIDHKNPTPQKWLILYFNSELDGTDIVNDFLQLPCVKQAQIVGVRTLA